MRALKQLFENNRAWAADTTRQDPDFFRRLSTQQSPHYLWIGCSDSRVPANQIVGLVPGEMFVHRNVANLVVHTDLNSSHTQISYADFFFKKNNIVCGHYSCGGILAALQDNKLWLIEQ